MVPMTEKLMFQREKIKRKKKDIQQIYISSERNQTRKSPSEPKSIKSKKE